MKFLKIVGIIFLVMVLAVVVLGIIAPKEGHVERTILIKADKQAVLDYAKSFKVARDWSPWMEKDPQVKITLKGTDGEVGSTYEWEGNDEVGAGKEEIKSITDSSVSIDLNFLKPFESQADTYFKVATVGDSTQLRWGFDTEYGFVPSIFVMLMDVNSALEKDFDLGLSRIKANTENVTVLK
jgi:hypothetical protein